MNQLNHHTTNYSFKLDLQDSSLKRQLQILIFSCFPVLARDQIPLSLLQPSQPLTYRSAIAVKLAPQHYQSPHAIATTIATHLSQNQSNKGNFTVSMAIQPQGWLDFLIGDAAIALWLQKLPTFLTQNAVSVKVNSINCNLFPLQYTHARCCALLRLGEQERLLPLNKVMYELKQTNIREWELLRQLMLTFDRLMTTANPDVAKLAMGLCESFWNFEKDCRIFGDFKENNWNLAVYRLKIVEIVQQVLAWLLLQGWEIIPLRDI